MKILPFIRIFIIVTVLLILFSVLPQPFTILSCQGITSVNNYQFTEPIYNETLVFPNGYPIFLKAIFATVYNSEKLKQLSPDEQENFLNNVPSKIPA